jgi:hypothetical protein
MGNKAHTTEDPRVGQLMDLYFAKANAPSTSPAESAADHLDADTLNAFVEGSLSEREIVPAIDHLLSCRFCLKSSAELIRLQNEFAEQTFERVVPESQASKISDVLAQLFGKVFGPSDAAVFAHEETEEKDESDKEDSKKDS